MYERFTDRARKVLVYANAEAERLDNEFVGTQHLLLGLLNEPGIARKFIEWKGISPGDLIRRIEEGMIRGVVKEITKPRREHDPSTKKALEWAIQEARNLNDNYVGTEHVLMGVLHETDARAGQILKEFKINKEEIVGFRTIHVLEQAETHVGQKLSKICNALSRHLSGELTPEGTLMEISRWVN